LAGKDPATPALGKDSLGNSVRFRPLDEPFRFTAYDPVGTPDGFFYNILLEHVMFRKQDELFSPGNTTRCYFKE
jgi:hypothetical protein